jgi:hypothetical protein
LPVSAHLASNADRDARFLTHLVGEGELVLSGGSPTSQLAAIRRQVRQLSSPSTRRSAASVVACQQNASTAS